MPSRQNDNQADWHDDDERGRTGILKDFSAAFGSGRAVSAHNFAQFSDGPDRKLCASCPSRDELVGTFSTGSVPAYRVKEGAALLQESIRLCARLPEQVSLARVEVELDFTSDQLACWYELVDIYDEVRDSVQAVEAISGFRFGEHAPTLAQVLEIDAKLLTVKLDAVRRLRDAVEKLGRDLTPRQKLHTDRLLAIHFRDLGSAPRLS